VRIEIISDHCAKNPAANKFTAGVFIRAEGFNTPPFRAVKKVLNPECNTSGEQHTSPFRVRLLIGRRGPYPGACSGKFTTRRKM
jgi:hypothetical protein